MLEWSRAYAAAEPRNPLAGYFPALRRVNGPPPTPAWTPFVTAWQLAATDPVFQRRRTAERDTIYFNPAVRRAKADGLGTLGQFIYYDAIVMHGPGQSASSFGGIRHQRSPAPPPPPRAAPKSPT